MDTGNLLAMARGPDAERERIREAIRRWQPIPVGSQLVLLVFAFLMAGLISFASELRSRPSALPALALVLMIPIGMCAANAMRIQRQLKVLADYVMRNER